MKVTMSSGTTPSSFHKEWAHPELGGALRGSHDSGLLKGPVSGPNPKLKMMGGPGGSKAMGSSNDSFVMDSSYKGPGNKEMQGVAMKDVPLNDFEHAPAKIGN